eukprot:CAMPEP_0194322544 /NCGR_PEP_ID=MMETSP0171-20130528/21203_1 /TAXON_ID=218684 /ORGANISM="Corethron pennatum, Strain L29A3" /LENGTH=167 /DNA_ID=CAMNT_0039080845 /DNA_START=317 /DNA_END=817 /DNA_ORIENTATION=-
MTPIAGDDPSVLDTTSSSDPDEENPKTIDADSRTGEGRSIGYLFLEPSLPVFSDSSFISFDASGSPSIRFRISSLLRISSSRALELATARSYASSAAGPFSSSDDEAVRTMGTLSKILPLAHLVAILGAIAENALVPTIQAVISIRRKDLYGTIISRDFEILQFAQN